MDINNKLQFCTCGNKNAKIRIEKGLLQADLDNMVGITSYSKQEYENGESKKQINKNVRCCSCKIRDELLMKVESSDEKCRESYRCN